MHVCFIGNNIHFLSSASGSAVLPREFIKSIYRDVEVSLITTEDNSTFKRRLREEPLKEFQPVLRYLNPIYRVRWSSASPLHALTSYKEISRFMKNSHADIIHIFDTPFSTLPLIRKLIGNTKAKVVYHAYMPLPETIGKVKALFLEKVADGIIASSPFILRFFDNAHRKRLVQVIPPPVDINIYKPNDRESKGGHTILYIGPLEGKRFPANLMVQLIKHLRALFPDLKLNMAIAPRFKDDQSMLSLIQKMAYKESIQENLRITYRRLLIEEKVSLYSNADVIVFPFTKSYKGVTDPPLTLLEAMSCGGLVVATKVLSIPWIIRDGYNGLLCSDITQLAKKIKEAFEIDDIYKKSLRNNAIKTIKMKFSHFKVREQILSFYKEILNQ
jgi:glycosyltransferase involved in cell wall biosynthesis